MKKQYKAGIVVAIALIAAFLVYDVFLNPARKMEGLVKQMVLERLVDPESAQFRNVSANPDTGFVCGEINSKNRMGGFTGYSIFAYHKGNLEFFDEKNRTSKYTDYFWAKCKS